MSDVLTNKQLITIVLKAVGQDTLKQVGQAFKTLGKDAEMASEELNKADEELSQVQLTAKETQQKMAGMHSAMESVGNLIGGNFGGALTTASGLLEKVRAGGNKFTIALETMTAGIALAKQAEEAWNESLARSVERLKEQREAADYTDVLDERIRKLEELVVAEGRHQESTDRLIAQADISFGVSQRKAKETRLITELTDKLTRSVTEFNKHQEISNKHYNALDELLDSVAYQFNKCVTATGLFATETQGLTSMQSSLQSQLSNTASAMNQYAGMTLKAAIAQRELDRVERIRAKEEEMKIPLNLGLLTRGPTSGPQFGFAGGIRAPWAGGGPMQKTPGGYGGGGGGGPGVRHSKSLLAAPMQSWGPTWDADDAYDPGGRGYGPMPTAREQRWADTMALQQGAQPIEMAQYGGADFADIQRDIDAQQKKEAAQKATWDKALKQLAVDLLVIQELHANMPTVEEIATGQLLEGLQSQSVDALKSSFVDLTIEVGNFFTAFALGEASLSAFGDAMLDLFGNLSSTIGSFFVQTGMGMFVLNPGGGTAMIAAGIALQALGGFMNAKGSANAGSGSGHGRSLGPVNASAFTPVDPRKTAEAQTTHLKVVILGEEIERPVTRWMDGIARRGGFRHIATR